MTAGARLTIDPAALARNFANLAARSRGACAGVVKANAYGLGIDVAAPALSRAGCDTFFVATQAEGFSLRALLPGATIFILNGLFGDPGEAIAARLIPLISSLDALADWPDAPFALNVDTGMNRLGLTLAEAATVTRQPVLLTSHFACADTPDHPQNADQEAAFATVRNTFPDVPHSLANSAALLTRPDSHFDLTRPGIALYGGRAAEGVAPLEPTVRLTAKVIQVRTVAAGEAVGYGAAERVRAPRLVAIVSLGYADGFLRAAGGADGKRGGPAFVNGRPARLIGRVSMDLVAVDVTEAPCARGDEVELFGPNVPLSDAAAAAGTIDYELLTGLSRRAERVIAPL
ncbi:MAG: alanine racemase [Pseudomonadota bacterium]